MRRSKARLLPLVLVLLAAPSCATNHLIRWAEGEPSYFEPPYAGYAPYVRPAGLVLGAPLAFAWDIVTLPFQYLWDVYPFGPEVGPDKVRDTKTVIQ